MLLDIVSVLPDTAVRWVRARLRRRRLRRHTADATLPVHSMLWVARADEVTVALSALPGVTSVDLGSRAGVARVRFDPAVTSTTQLKVFINACGYHCRGEYQAGHDCPTNPVGPYSFVSGPSARKVAPTSTPPSAGDRRRPILKNG